ncbi:hypothetical protein QQ045_012336 [Rhodiola kirilowii]
MTRVLKNVLTTYEFLSGQMINYAKSEVVLSHNAPSDMCANFSNSLGVKRVHCHEKYLELPLVLNRKLSANFTEVLDRVWSKANGWSAARLSSGGMIKGKALIS